MFRLLCCIDEIADGLTKRQYAAVEVARRMDAVGKEGPGFASVKIDP
jgi:hypothetical protein